MPGPQIAKQIDFSKGIYAAVNRFGQPPGTIHSASNFVYDRTGALQTCDGSLITCSQNAAGPVTQQYPFRFLGRYAQTGFPDRRYVLQPTGANVNVINVSTNSWVGPEITVSSSYDIPSAVQAGDVFAIALGAGTTPAILHNNPLVSAGSWINTWNAAPNIPIWIANVQVNIGQPVQPTTPNGHIYVALGDETAPAGTVTGTTGATQPVFPTATGATVTDGTVVWQEAGTTSAPIPPGADFFFYHQGSLWAWGTSTSYNNLDGPDALRMSDLNAFFSWNPLNATYIGKGDGTVPMGGAVMTLGEAGIAATAQIVLFKNTTTYVVLGSLGPQGQVRLVPTGVGCVAPGTVVFIEELGVVRLSERGITTFDGQNDAFQQMTDPIRAYLFGGVLDIMPVDWSHIRYAKACRVHNPPAYLMACPIANYQQASVRIGTSSANPGAMTGTFNLPAGLPLASSIYMTTSWNTNVWQTNTPSLGTINWATDTPVPSTGGTIYWMVAFGGAGSGALTRLFVYHIVLQAWAVVDLPFAISTLAFIPQNPYPNYTLCGGTYDGTVRRLFAGDQDWDGQPIVGMVTIPEIGNPVTPSYVKEVAINGRAKFSAACGFTTSVLSYTDRSGLILQEPLFVANNQVPVYVDIDKTMVSGSLRLNTSGPLLIEGLEIAIQPKQFMSWDLNRDGGYTTLNPPTGPPGSHGATIPAATYTQGALGVGAGGTSLTITLPGGTLSNYMVTLAPDWDTTYWVASQTNISVIVSFGTPAPAGGGLVSYNFFAAANQKPVVAWPVAAGSFNTAVPLSMPVGTTYVPVITPSWNTQFWITGTSPTSFSVAFDTPAPPGGGTMYYTAATVL